MADAHSTKARGWHLNVGKRECFDHGDRIYKKMYRVRM
jgi:hypothetical protein